MLTPYQRGHRDALEAFAATLEDLDIDHKAHARNRAAAMQVVARLCREGLSKEDAQRLADAFTYPTAPRMLAQLALRRSEALPHDPEGEE